MPSQSNIQFRRKNYTKFKEDEKSKGRNRNFSLETLAKAEQMKKLSNDPVPLCQTNDK